MASTLGALSDVNAERLRYAHSTLCSRINVLIPLIRRNFALMKEVAVAFERDNKSQVVKKLEKVATELMDCYEDFLYLSSALESVGNSCRPGTESTDLDKLFEREVARWKASSYSNPEKHRLMHQFREAIWNVHHAGVPMPGEEQEDVIITSTQYILLNITCPLSGKPVTELAEPVCSMDCKHIYDKKAIMVYLKSKHVNARCPVADLHIDAHGPERVPSWEKLVLLQAKLFSQRGEGCPLDRFFNSVTSGNRPRPPRWEARR